MSSRTFLDGVKTDDRSSGVVVVTDVGSGHSWVVAVAVVSRGVSVWGNIGGSVRQHSRPLLDQMLAIDYSVNSSAGVVLVQVGGRVIRVVSRNPIGGWHVGSRRYELGRTLLDQMSERELSLIGVGGETGVSGVERVDHGG